MRAARYRPRAAMSLTVVGSIAFDAVETETGKRDRLLGGSAVHFSLASSFFADTRVVGPVGDDFGRGGVRRAALARGHHRRHRARPGRQDVLLGRPLRARRQPPPHAADRPQRLRALPAVALGGLRGRRRRLPRQHPARPPARGPRAVHAGALRGDGLDEPVDRHRARVAAAHDQPRRRRDPQRRRAQAAHRRAQPRARGAQGARPRPAASSSPSRASTAPRCSRATATSR